MITDDRCLGWRCLLYAELILCCVKRIEHEQSGYHDKQRDENNLTVTFDH